MQTSAPAEIPRDLNGIFSDPKVDVTVKNDSITRVVIPGLHFAWSCFHDLDGAAQTVIFDS